MRMALLHKPLRDGLFASPTKYIRATLNTTRQANSILGVFAPARPRPPVSARPRPRRGHGHSR